MRRNCKWLLAICLCALALGALYAWQRTRTPEYALQQVAAAIEARDMAKLEAYADIEGITENAYDDAAALLVDNVADLHAKYPHDFFFDHASSFMSDYISLRRANDLALIQEALHLYMDPGLATARDTDKAARRIVEETNDLLPEYDVAFRDVTASGDEALATFSVRGHDTLYGRLLPELALAVELRRQPSGRWRVTRITNVAVLFDPTVDAIEAYWLLKGWQ